MLSSARIPAGASDKNPFRSFRLRRAPRERYLSVKAQLIELHLKLGRHPPEMDSHLLRAGSTDTDLSTLVGRPLSGAPLPAGGQSGVASGRSIGR
jgi:hypothetical protein